MNVLHPTTARREAVRKTTVKEKAFPRDLIMSLNLRIMNGKS